MAMELVLRKKARAGGPIVPRQLLRKNGLTKREWGWVYRDVTVGIAGALGIATTIPMEVLTDGTFMDVAWGLGIGAASVMAVGGFVSAMDRDDRPNQRGSFKQRYEAVYWTKHAEAAPHAADRGGRAKDVDYPWYSPNIFRQGDEIMVEVMRSERDDESPGAGWKYLNKHSSTRFAVDNAGSFGIDEGKRIRIPDPTLDKVDEAWREVCDVAASLEDQAYESAASRRKLDRMALLYKAPEGPTSARAKHYGDELDAGVASLLA